MKTASPGMDDHENTFFVHHVFDPLETKVNPGSINLFFLTKFYFAISKKEERKSYLEQGPVLLGLEKKSCISLHFRGDSDDPNSFCFPYGIT